MSRSHLTIQQWLDSLPQTPPTSQHQAVSTQGAPTSSSDSRTIMPQSSQKQRLFFLPRELSLQSDDVSSHCSSVESVLEQRKPDPEKILIGLGFGPSPSNSPDNRIPERFLQPSKLLPHIDINKFLEKQGIPRRRSDSCPSSPARYRRAH